MEFAFLAPNIDARWVWRPAYNSTNRDSKRGFPKGSWLARVAYTSKLWTQMRNTVSIYTVGNY